jgi:excisionase family DNA binding protein
MAVHRDPSSIVITPEEAASLLCVGRSKVFELIASGDLVSIRIGRCRRIEREEITAYIARQRDSVRPADEEYGEERTAS